MYGRPGVRSAARPPPPAPDPGAPSVLTSSRYVYLATRLRERQITMEEATELFGILQSAVVAAGRVPRVPPPPPPPPPEGKPAGGGVRILLSDDDLALGLVALGAGTGLLAAVLKRATEGPAASKSK